MMKAPRRLGALAVLGVTLACAAPQDGEGQGAVDAGAAAADAGVAAADAGAQPVEDAGPIEPQKTSVSMRADEAALDGTFGEANETASGREALRSRMLSAAGYQCHQRVCGRLRKKRRNRWRRHRRVFELFWCQRDLHHTERNVSLRRGPQLRQPSLSVRRETRGVNCFDAYSNCSGRPATATCP